jgi:enoyl-CoA hydratase/carnithine racemase
MAGQIRVSLEAEIATVTISQPGKRNALTVEMWGELKAAFDKASADTALRCIEMRGDGDEAFSAGADMSEFERVRSTREQVIEFHENSVRGALTAILECPIPVVAAIGGVCMGGGLEIAAVCDLRIGGESSRFGAPVGRHGFPLAFAETQALFRIVGPATMAELLLEGRILDAREAFAKGLVTRIVPDADVASEARATARRICESSPLALRSHKQQIRRLTRDASPVTSEERMAVYAFADSEDYRLGYRAFLSKQKANFVGR